jgi:hypothetical protein
MTMLCSLLYSLEQGDKINSDINQLVIDLLWHGSVLQDYNDKHAPGGDAPSPGRNGNNARNAIEVGKCDTHHLNVFWTFFCSILEEVDAFSQEKLEQGVVQSS